MQVGPHLRAFAPVGSLNGAKADPHAPYSKKERPRPATTTQGVPRKASDRLRTLTHTALHKQGDRLTAPTYTTAHVQGDKLTARTHTISLARGDNALIKMCCMHVRLHRHVHVQAPDAMMHAPRALGAVLAAILLSTR